MWIQFFDWLDIPFIISCRLWTFIWIWHESIPVDSRVINMVLSCKRGVPDPVKCRIRKTKTYRMKLSQSEITKGYHMDIDSHADTSCSSQHVQIIEHYFALPLLEKCTFLIPFPFFQVFRSYFTVFSPFITLFY